MVGSVAKSAAAPKSNARFESSAALNLEDVVRSVAIPAEAAEATEAKGAKEEKEAAAEKAKPVEMEAPRSLRKGLRNSDVSKLEAKLQKKAATKAVVKQPESAKVAAVAGGKADTTQPKQAKGEERPGPKLTKAAVLTAVSAACEGLGGYDEVSAT